MTLFDIRGALDPGSAAFDFDELADIGLVFPEEQRALFTRQVAHRDRGTFALGIHFLADPEHPMSAAPMVCMDDAGELSLAVAPAIVELDEELGGWVGEGTVFERFPTLSGRQLEPVVDPVTGNDVEIGAPMGYRLWHLWPIDGYLFDVEDVLDQVRAWRSFHYDLFPGYFAADQGEIYACDIVDRTSYPHDQHTHIEHLDRPGGDPIIIQCIDADEWMESFKQGHFRLDHDGMLVPKPPKPFTFHDPQMQVVWEQLQASSQMASHRALQLFGPEEREPILRTERYYSPWLWLS